MPSDAVGSVIEKIGARKGEMVQMHQVGERMRLEFLIPSRGLFGYSNDFLTDTKGEGIMSTIFEGYAPYKGTIAKRSMGSLIAQGVLQLKRRAFNGAAMFLARSMAEGRSGVSLLMPAMM